MQKRTKDAVFFVIALTGSIVLCLFAGEAMLRVKNSSMTNYDIEMWRYAMELKVKSPDEILAFVHAHSRSALLQGVTVRTNERGLRGPAVRDKEPGERRILFLGGSITLGWGVPEEATLTSQLEQIMKAGGERALILNAGVGNYNAERYVARYFKELSDLEPSDIVVQYFLRDAEELPQGGGNILLRHSQLAVTLWIVFHRLFDQGGEKSLVDHYRKVYQPEAAGFLTMRSSLARLGDYAKKRGIRIYLAMTPDVHNLVDYKLAFVHELMRGVAAEAGYTFVDFLPALRGLPPESLFAMPGDPHPNVLGHEFMAKAIAPVLMAAPSQLQAAKAGK